MVGATFSGCEETTLDGDDAGNDIEVAKRMSAITGSSYYYFRCNATGWGADATTRMGETGTAGVYTIEVDVNEPWMTDTGDTCTITETDALDGWGAQQSYYGLDYTHYLFQVPGEEQATLYTGGDPHFKVRYPSLDRFQARFDSNTLTLTIGGDATPPTVGHVIEDIGSMNTPYVSEASSGVFRISDFPNVMYNVVTLVVEPRDGKPLSGDLGVGGSTVPLSG